MNIENQMLVDQVLRISNKLIFMEKKSIIEHEGVKLYPSEIHLMNVIDAEKDMNASEMAKKLGVTKGAVSQTLSRLDEKGIISKTKDPMDKNKLTVRFTQLGQSVFKKHVETRAVVQKQFADYLSDLAHEEREIVSSFLKNLESFLNHMG